MQNNDDLKREVEDLRRELREHTHNGFNGGQIYFKHLFGLIETVSTAPTTVPKTTYDQLKIYTNGSDYRFYWYDSIANVWHYVTATA